MWSRDSGELSRSVQTRQEQLRTLGAEGDDKPDKRESEKKGPLRSGRLGCCVREMAHERVCRAAVIRSPLINRYVYHVFRRRNRPCDNRPCLHRGVRQAHTLLAMVFGVAGLC